MWFFCFSLGVSRCQSARSEVCPCRLGRKKIVFTEWGRSSLAEAKASLRSRWPRWPAVLHNTHRVSGEVEPDLALDNRLPWTIGCRRGPITNIPSLLFPSWSWVRNDAETANLRQLFDDWVIYSNLSGSYSAFWLPNLVWVPGVEGWLAQSSWPENAAPWLVCWIWEEIPRLQKNSVFWTWQGGITCGTIPPWSCLFWDCSDGIWKVWVVVISMYAPWNCFSLCWGLSKIHLGVFLVAVRREEGWILGGLDCPGEPHGSLYFWIYSNTKYFSCIGFRFHLATFPLHFGPGRFVRYWGSGLMWNREAWGLGEGSLNLVLGNILQELEKRPSWKGKGCLYPSPFCSFLAPLTPSPRDLEPCLWRSSPGSESWTCVLICKMKFLSVSDLA